MAQRSRNRPGSLRISGSIPTTAVAESTWIKQLGIRASHDDGGRPSWCGSMSAVC